MPVVGGVAFGADRGNDVSRARQMAEYERMAERGLNVERQRNSLLSSMNRMERERMQMAQRNFDSLRNSTNQMRQQNQAMRESYSLQGMQARSTERVADIHRELTESLSLERVLSRAIGVIWETQVARGAKLASKIIADIPNNNIRAARTVDLITSAFNGLSAETASMAAQYNEDVIELNSLHTKLLSTMRFTTAELEAGAHGAAGLVTHLNQSVANLTRVGILLEDVEGTINYAAEAAQRGMSFDETARGLTVVDRMVRKISTDIKKGPTAELNNFDHILREKVIKSVQELMTNFGGINASLERTAVLITNAGRGAQRMGATMQEAAGIQGAIGNTFMNVRGRGDDINFLAGERLRRNIGLSGGRRGRGANQETEQQRFDRVNAAMTAQGMRRAGIDDTQWNQRVRRQIENDHGGQQMTANIGAMEEYGQTGAGIRALSETMRDLFLRQGTDPATQTELIMEQFGVSSRMQASMIRDMIQSGEFSNIESQVTAAQEQARLNAEITDPVRQAQAIVATSEGIGTLVAIQNVAGRDMRANIDRMTTNVMRMGAAFLPQGMLGRLYQHVTGDTSSDVMAAQPRDQAGANAAAHEQGAVSAGVVVAGATDERTGGAVVRQGAGTSAANISFGATMSQIERDHERNRAGAGTGFGVLSDVSRHVDTLGNMNASTGDRLNAAGRLLGRFNPLGLIGSGFQAIGGAGEAAAGSLGDGGAADRAQAQAQVLREFQTRFQDDAATASLREELGRAGSTEEAERIVRAHVTRATQREGAVTPTAPATPGNAPTPSATPSAQGAAGAVTAPQAARQNTAAGQSGGMGRRASLEPLPGGDAELNMKVRISGIANTLAASQAQIQAATATT